MPEIKFSMSPDEVNKIISGRLNMLKKEPLLFCKSAYAPDTSHYFILEDPESSLKVKVIYNPMHMAAHKMFCASTTSLGIFVDDFFTSLPNNLRKAVLMHEIYHIKNKDLSFINMMRYSMSNRDHVERSADMYALKHASASSIYDALTEISVKMPKALFGKSEKMYQRVIEDLVNRADLIRKINF